jgi:hypothetical protein
MACKLHVAHGGVLVWLVLTEHAAPALHYISVKTTSNDSEGVRKLKTFPH